MALRDGSRREGDAELADPLLHGGVIDATERSRPPTTHEMRAWYALTQGNYRGAIQAASAGEEAAPSHGVAVQLLAQRAKAWHG